MMEYGSLHALRLLFGSHTVARHWWVWRVAGAAAGDMEGVAPGLAASAAGACVARGGFRPRHDGQHGVGSRVAICIGYCSARQSRRARKTKTLQQAATF